MSRMNWFAHAALGCGVALAGAGFGYAQRVAPPIPATPPPPPATSPAPATAPVTRTATEARPAPADAANPRALHAKDVMGSKISLKGGVAIGTVEDIIFDDSGDIDYLVVANEGKDVLVPWEAAKFDFSNRTAMVDITQDQFKQVPTYAPTELPSNLYEPAFQTKLYGYYNLKPGQVRRIERRDR